MTTRTVTIAPISKTITVRASQARAFAVFTGDMGSWWPMTHHIGVSPLTDILLEARVGGRWLTRHEDGSEIAIGHVRAWDPPSGLVASWEINAQWGADTRVASEVEVRFIPEAANRTRVEVEHRSFDVLGQADGAKMRSDVAKGWPTVLARFEQALSALV